MRIAEDIRPALQALDLDALDATEATVYVLRADLSLGACNESYTSFARANGANPEPELRRGSGSVLDAIAGPLRKFYKTLFESVLRSGTAAEHEYACHSPTQLRRVRMRVLPVDRVALLTVHRSVVARPEDIDPQSWLDTNYRSGPYLVQCCHCRSTRRAHQPATWDWVPELVEPRDDVSHGLCPPCFAHYFSDAARQRLASLGRLR